MSFFKAWLKATAAVFVGGYAAEFVVPMLNVPTDGIFDELATSAVIAAAVVLSRKVF